MLCAQKTESKGKQSGTPPARASRPPFEGMTMDEELDYWNGYDEQHDEWLDHVEPDANPWGGFADGDDEGMTI